LILVTLGTHPAPMDRVVEAIDRLIEDGSIDTPVIVQAAAFRVRPRRAEAADVVPFDQLAGWARDAESIVTHAGPGSIMLALAAGRRPVVIPRMARFREHVDDHQVRFARWITEKLDLPLVEDVSQLGDAIRSTRGAGAAGRRPGPSPDVIRKLRETIEDGGRP
jgi:UDP-N-acetylglucosamine transferase subunit ALG13